MFFSRLKFLLSIFGLAVSVSGCSFLNSSPILNSAASNGLNPNNSELDRLLLEENNPAALAKVENLGVELRRKISAASQYLNEMQAPKPTPGTCSGQYASTHPYVFKAYKSAVDIYLLTPGLKYTQTLVPSDEQKFHQRTLAYKQAMIEAQNGNQTDNVAIMKTVFSQTQPQSWGNYFLGCMSFHGY